MVYHGFTHICIIYYGCTKNAGQQKKRHFLVCPVPKASHRQSQSSTFYNTVSSVSSCPLRAPLLENPMKMDDLWVPPFFRKPPHKYPATTYKRELQFYLSPDPGQQYLLGRLSHYLSDCHGYFILHDSLVNMQMRSYWVYICKAYWAIPFKMHFHFRPLLRVTSRNFRENLPVSYIWCTRIIHNILLSPT